MNEFNSITREILDREEVVFPNSLVYKYRDWNDTCHKSLLLDRKVYFSSPNGFQDKGDCRTPIRYDLLRMEDWIEKYNTELRESSPNLSRPDRRRIVKQRAQTAFKNIKKPRFLDDFQANFFEKYFQRIGVLSLTTDPLNRHLWTEYAKNFSGFCVGFDCKLLFDTHPCGCGPVLYGEDIPIIYPYPKHSESAQSKLQTYFKLKEYEDEDEYRFYIFKKDPHTDHSRTLILPKTAFMEIILGYAMSAKSKDEIVNIAKSDFEEKISLFELCINDKNELFKQPIL